MFQLLRNLIIICLSTSLFVVGCADSSGKKRVRLPMRNGSNQKTTPPGVDDKGDKKTPPEIDIDEDVQKRQDAYEAVRQALDKGSEKSLKNLEAGTYKITSLATEYLVNNKHFGVIAMHTFNEASLESEVKVKGLADGLLDKTATALNITSEFKLTTGDKLEVSNAAVIKLTTKADLSKPQSIATLDKIVTTKADGLNNLDLITAADINSSNPVEVDAFNKSMGHKTQMTILDVGVGNDEIRMRITIELSAEEIRNIFVTYKFTKVSAEDEKTEKTEKTEKEEKEKAAEDDEIVET